MVAYAQEHGVIRARGRHVRQRRLVPHHRQRGRSDREADPRVPDQVERHVLPPARRGALVFEDHHSAQGASTSSSISTAPAAVGQRTGAVRLAGRPAAASLEAAVLPAGDGGGPQGLAERRLQEDYLGFLLMELSDVAQHLAARISPEDARCTSCAGAGIALILASCGTADLERARPGLLRRAPCFEAVLANRFLFAQDRIGPAPGGAFGEGQAPPDAVPGSGPAAGPSATGHRPAAVGVVGGPGWWWTAAARCGPLRPPALPLRLRHPRVPELPAAGGSRP